MLRNKANDGLGEMDVEVVADDIHRVLTAALLAHIEMHVDVVSFSGLALSFEDVNQFSQILRRQPISPRNQIRIA